MRLPPYLLVRPSGYYFRYAVPHDLRVVVGKTEIRRSLSTHNRHEALLQAARLSDNVQKKFAALRTQMAGIPEIDFDNIRNFEIESLQIGGAKLTGVKVDSSNPKDVEAFTKVVQMLNEQYEPESPATALASTGQIAAPVPPDATPAQPPSAGSGKNMLSQIFPIYQRQREKSGLSQHSLAELTASFNLLLDVIGDKPVPNYTQDDANYFVDIIQQLPPNRNKVAAYRGRSIDEVLKIRQQLEQDENHRRRLDTDRPYIPADLSMSPRTVDKHISLLGTFFKWAIGKGYVHGKNFFEGQKIQTKAQREADTENAREPFSDEDLKKIFSPSNYQSRKNAADFWFPLIALFSGLRLNEIAQLHLVDVTKIFGTWIFKVNDNAPDKSIKNATSRRLVPVHPQLIALGFADFYEDMKKLDKVRLFPQLKYVNGGYGRQPGRSFGDYLTSIGITEKVKVFHSFRHTFSNQLKQDALLPDEARSELAGHAHPGVNSNVYTEVHRLPNKRKFISMLKFDGLVLDHLRYQPGQFSLQASLLGKSEERIRAQQASRAKHLEAKLERERRNRRS